VWHRERIMAPKSNGFLALAWRHFTLRSQLNVRRP
jgi:hypothetical protein